MKIKLSNKESKQSRPYPKLMIKLMIDNDEGDIYFMSRYGVGTIICSTNEGWLGIRIDDLNMSNMVDYEGEITLSND
jgi:hypothetical protein